MNTYLAIDLLKEKWLDCLSKQGHYILNRDGTITIVRSRNGKKGRYRWLLQVSENPTRVFSRSELAGIRQHLRQAKQAKESTYIVVGFLIEPRRIVVVPAAAALKAGCVRSGKGGIAWED